MCDGGRWLSSVGKELVEEALSLSSLEVSVPIGIVLVEDVHCHDLHVFVLVERKIQEVFHEEECFEFGDNTIIVEVNLLVEPIEL